METTNQEPTILNMETDSNINTIINTTPEDIKQVNKTRGRPKTTEQQTKEQK